MTHYGIFYHLLGPYGPVHSDHFEVFLCYAENKTQAREKFREHVPKAQIEFIMQECDE